MNFSEWLKDKLSEPGAPREPVVPISYAGILLATSRSNALPIGPNERRFAMLKGARP